MIDVVVTAERPGRWWRRARKTFRRALPERWDEVPDIRTRRLYYRWLMADERLGLQYIIMHRLRLPGWASRAMRVEEVAAMAGALAWMPLRPDCEALPFPSFRHQGVTYHFPTPKGENITCIEYPLADEYYTQFVQEQSDSALLMLTATLVREEEHDLARILREDDYRVPLYGRAEIRDRANRLRTLPGEYQMATLLFFAGLKAYVHRVYGAHIFEETEDDQDDDNDDDQNEKRQAAQEADPGFGWWGVLQDVAEAGLFGPMRDVYQASFHEVCLWLVRQRIKEREMKNAYSTPPRPTTHPDDV